MCTIFVQFKLNKKKNSFSDLAPPPCFRLPSPLITQGCMANCWTSAPSAWHAAHSLPPIKSWRWREQVPSRQDPELEHDVACLGSRTAQHRSLSGAFFLFIPTLFCLLPFLSFFSLVFTLKAWPRKGRLSMFHNITAHFFLLFTSKIPSSHI